MDEDVALLRAALADPADRTPWLVYADWLDERSDPRGKWLRLGAELETIPARSPRAAELRAEREALRPHLPPDWATLTDRSDRYTVMVPSDVWARMRREGAEGKPLARLNGWGNANCDFDRMKVGPGNYLYPLLVRNKRVIVLTRMRVADLGGDYRNHVIAAESAPVRTDRVIPGDVLARMRFRSMKAERPLKFVEDGLLIHATGLQGVYRLTHASGQDLDWLFYRPEGWAT